MGKCIITTPLNITQEHRYTTSTIYLIYKYIALQQYQRWVGCSPLSTTSGDTDDQIEHNPNSRDMIPKYIHVRDHPQIPNTNTNIAMKMIKINLKCWKSTWINMFCHRPLPHASVLFIHLWKW